MQTRSAPVIDETFRPTARRVDLYADIHKALRHWMSRTMVRIGSTDHADDADVAEMTGCVRDLLAMCVAHVDKENRYVHPAIEARAPEASRRIGDEHVHHLDAIADLEEDVRVVEATTGVARETAIARLYHHVALFMADNLVHMHVEETAHNAVLWAHYDDDELLAIHRSILASLAPEEMMPVLGWMLPAITPASRAAMLAGMRMGMPAPVFGGVLASARACLDAKGWEKLVVALG